MLLEKNVEHVVVLDALTYTGRRENLAVVEQKITFVEGDICDGER